MFVVVSFAVRSTSALKTDMTLVKNHIFFGNPSDSFMVLIPASQVFREAIFFHRAILVTFVGIGEKPMAPGRLGISQGRLSRPAVPQKPMNSYSGL